MTKATEEYRKFNYFDDQEFEVQFCGPTGTGNGDGVHPVGCKSFFDELGVTDMEIKQVGLLVNQLNTSIRSKQGRKVCDFLSTLCSAFRLSE